jgi:hypothetical protein
LVTIALGKVVVDVLADHGFKSVMCVLCGGGSDIGNAIV